MDKFDDKVTFVYEAKENQFLTIFKTLGFIFILSMIIFAIYRRDYFMGFLSIVIIMIFMGILTAFYRNGHLSFDKEKKIVYLNEFFFFKKSVSPLCSFNKIKEVRIIGGKDGIKKVYSEVLIEDIVINSKKNILINEMDYDRNELMEELLFKELIEEAVKVSDTVGCTITYCRGLLVYVESLIKKYRNT